MARAQRFEDLFAWQRARELAKQVNRLCQHGPLARDANLRGQLRRSARSAMTNIAEGLQRGGHREFRQFLSIAGASCAEVRSHLYSAEDADLLSADEAARISHLAKAVEGLIDRLRAKIPVD